MAKTTHKPEIIVVDSSGARWPAKIVGYNTQGKLPPPNEGEVRITAEQAALDLSTIGIDFSGEVPVEGKELVKIQEYRVCETKSGRIKDGQELIGMRPVIDVLANIGNNKRGEIWQFIGGLSHGRDIVGAHLQKSGLGAAVQTKRFFQELPPAPKVVTPPPAPKVVTPPPSIPFVPNPLDEEAIAAVVARGYMHEQAVKIVQEHGAQSILDSVAKEKAERAAEETAKAAAVQADGKKKK